MTELMSRGTFERYTNLNLSQESVDEQTLKMLEGKQEEDDALEISFDIGKFSNMEEMQ